MAPPSSPEHIEEKPSRESKPEPGPEPKPERPAYPPVREQNIRQENNTPVRGTATVDSEGNPVYQGRFKIDIAPPVDADQLSSLEQNLQKTADVRVIAKGAAEDGSAWIEIELSKPASLLEILRRLPGIKDVVGAKSYIIVAMKSKQLV